MCNTHFRFLSSVELDQIFSTFDKEHFYVSFFSLLFLCFRSLNHLLKDIGVRIRFFKSPNRRTFLCCFFFYNGTLM